MKRLWLKRILLIFLTLFILAVISTGSFFLGMASGFLLNSDSTALSEEVISGEDFEEKIGILRLEGIILTSGTEDIFSSEGLISSNQVSRWLKQLETDVQLK